MANRKSCLLVALLLLAVPQSTGAAEEGPSLALPGAHPGVIFNAYPPIANAGEVASRLLSPIAAEAVRRRVQLLGTRLKPEMFDISRERYLLYVPRREPPGGYGLLVFVPPWPQAEIPNGWTAVLDRYGFIFVSAVGSGNDQKVFERRIPLAIAGLASVQSIFRIDPARILIGGFSGGARVAMRIALAYPDKFAGALLNAGSDPIAQTATQLPSPDLLLAFQTRMKLAYVTGEQDEGGLSLDSASRSSMQHWCVANLSVRNDRAVGHETANTQGLDWAFQALLASTKPDSASMSACRAARRHEVDLALERAEQAIASGQPRDARRLITQIDQTYGGLAAPRSIGLADRCSCGIFDPRPDAVAR